MSRTTYADLFAVVGIQFGSGSGVLYAVDDTGSYELWQVDVVTPANSVLLGSFPAGLSLPARSGQPRQYPLRRRYYW